MTNVSTGYTDNSYWVNQNGESSDSEATPSKNEFKTLVHQIVPNDNGVDPAENQEPKDVKTG